MVSPGKDPLNVKILFDLQHLNGYANEYNSIVRVFQSYRHQPLSEDNWRGVTISSTEFSRGITIGTTKSLMSTNIAKKNEKELEAFRRPPSPSIFSKDFHKI